MGTGANQHAGVAKGDEMILALKDLFDPRPFCAISNIVAIESGIANASFIRQPDGAFVAADDLNDALPVLNIVLAIQADSREDNSLVLPQPQCMVCMRGDLPDILPVIYAYFLPVTNAGHLSVKTQNNCEVVSGSN